ncbi:MAG TPA: ACT domain-containing protein [Actinomycetes bacterium]
MATDLTLYLDDHPGELARITGLLGAAGVNIHGFCAVSSGGGKAEVHVLIDDAPAAFSTLAAAGVRIASEQEVLVVAVQDRPGILGEVSSKLGRAGVNITLAYLATDTRLVFASDDLAAAKAALP